MPKHLEAFVVLPGCGKKVQGPVGGPAIIKAGTNETGGSFAFIENTVAPKQGPPLHVHGREDEMWYILEGSFRFKVDKKLHYAPAGSFVFVPRGARHCFQNIGDAPARIFVMFTPSGMEKFFEEHAKLPQDAIDPVAYRNIARNCEMEVVGTPLSESDPL